MENACTICLQAAWKRLFQEGGCSVPVAVNSDVQDEKVCPTFSL